MMRWRWGFFSRCKKKNCYLPVVGFDNDAVMKEFLSTGKLVATADIFSSQMAVRGGIEFALDVLEGKIENRGVHSTVTKLLNNEFVGKRPILRYALKAPAVNFLILPAMSNIKKYSFYE